MHKYCWNCFIAVTYLQNSKHKFNLDTYKSTFKLEIFNKQ